MAQGTKKLEAGTLGGLEAINKGSRQKRRKAQGSGRKGNRLICE